MGKSVEYTQETVDEIAQDILGCLLEMVSDDVWVYVQTIEAYLMQGEYGKKYAWLYKDFTYAFHESLDALNDEGLLVQRREFECEFYTFSYSDEIKMTFKEVWKYYWSKYNDRSN